MSRVRSPSYATPQIIVRAGTRLIDAPALRADTLAGKIARYPLRMIPRGLAVPILRGPLRGKKWIVGSFLHRCWMGSYELEFQQHLVAEVKPDSVFYDIGANVGFHALLASKLVAAGQVYAFEPLPANLRFLRKHLEMNHSTNVDVLGLAISDECGSAPFESEDSRGMGHLAQEGECYVQTSTIDALVDSQRIASPNYIKMDIEGAEFRALHGAKNTFARYKPVLFLATHGTEVHGNCCELLSSWRYEFQTIRKSEPGRAELVARPRS